ncbi:MAG TPA: endonuclease V [Acidimicrobiales bacterium]|nr:endonuclease V [Acidimicrobiales bacterium]
MPAGWPTEEGELIAEQSRVAAAARQAEPWVLPADTKGIVAGGCFLAYASGEAGPGGPEDHAWAAAVLWPLPGPDATARLRRPDRPLIGTGPGGPRRARDVADQSLVAGQVPAGYRAGLLALREGPLLEAAVRSLLQAPDVLLVDATGFDHPRRAGLALHLGVVLGIPTVGVTHRPLVAEGAPPVLTGRGEISPVWISGELVGYWVCTRGGARPVVAHAGWRTSPETAAAVVLSCSSEGARTPVPLGEARRVAREARAIAEGRVQVRPPAL